MGAIPQIDTEFLEDLFSKETDRGAVLLAHGFLDEQLKAMFLAVAKDSNLPSSCITRRAFRRILQVCMGKSGDFLSIALLC